MDPKRKRAGQREVIEKFEKDEVLQGQKACQGARQPSLEDCSEEEKLEGCECIAVSIDFSGLVGESSLNNTLVFRVQLQSLGRGCKTKAIRGSFAPKANSEVR
jgi:hypothetical protein